MPQRRSTYVRLCTSKRVCPSRMYTAPLLVAENRRSAQRKSHWQGIFQVTSTEKSVRNGVRKSKREEQEEKAEIESNVMPRTLKFP